MQYTGKTGNSIREEKLCQKLILIPEETQAGQSRRLQQVFPVHQEQLPPPQSWGDFERPSV